MSSARIASLGMYDPPWLHRANDALWAGIAERLRAAGLADVPAKLQRDRPLLELWRDPRLLLAQTCGYPLRTQLRGQVRVVGTPCYATPYSAGARYRSVLVVGHDSRWSTLAQLRGQRVAVNAMDSQSGMNLLRAMLAPLADGRPFFGEVRHSGSHLRSLALVAAGEAELAAIDGVSFTLVQRHRPEQLAGVRVLAQTADSPGLPLITRRAVATAELALLRRVLREAASDPALSAARAALSLRGFRRLPAGAYERVLAQQRRAIALGYPQLC